MKEREHAGLGVPPLYPGCWADPQILLPSLCCFKPPPRLLLTCARCTKHHTHKLPTLCNSMHLLSPFLCHSPELSQLGWIQGWETLGARRGWVQDVGGCRMLECSLTPAAPWGSVEVGALQGLPCAIGWHFVTPPRRTGKALPTRGRKAELETSGWERVAAMSRFCHSLSQSASVLCRTPRL